MIQNYFKIAWRSLVRYRLSAFINIVGLTLGLAVAIVLFWIVRFEYSFDKYHLKADRFYRIRDLDKFGDMNSHVPQGAVNALKNEVPGVEKAANVRGYPPNSLKVGQEVFDMKYVFFVEPDFMEMIDVEWLEGSARESLSKPDQVVLDEPTARKFFKGNPVGQIIRMDNNFNLTVTGVIRKAPANSDFQFPMIISYETQKRLEQNYQEDYWGGGDSFQHGYVLLKPGVDPKKAESALTAKVLKKQDQTDIRSFNFLPVSESHFDLLNDPYNYFIPEWMLYTLSSIGLFLIVVACINFINLSTAQVSQRSREVGVRKVLGSNRRQLVFQFLGETGLLVLASVICGSLLGTWMVGRADQLLNTQVAQSNVWDFSSITFLAVLIISVTLLAGLYPGLVLSKFQPAQAFRKQMSVVSRWGISLRQALVVMQFVVAQGLVICTIIGVQQIRYMIEKDLGFNKSAVVTVAIPERRKDEVMRNQLKGQLLSHPEIREVTFGLTSPVSDRNNWWGGIKYSGFPKGESLFRVQHIDTDYFDFYRIPLVAGRKLTPSDSASSSLVINEKAVREMGFNDEEKVLGHQLEYGGRKCTVVGVVKDYHSEDLKSKLIPHLFAYTPRNFQLISIRIDAGKSEAALQSIATEWKKQFPNHYFKYQFLDDTIKSAYASELKLSNFLTLFAVVGIFIGCLGLFGLVSFVVIQRNKEIGIRKILGATMTNIVSLLSTDFLKLVVVAFIIAIPVGYFPMKMFLQNYEYKITMEWWVFLLAGGLAAIVAFATVGYHALKASLMNPVKSLKSE